MKDNEFEDAVAMYQRLIKSGVYPDPKTRQTSGLTPEQQNRWVREHLAALAEAKRRLGQ